MMIGKRVMIFSLLSLIFLAIGIDGVVADILSPLAYWSLDGDGKDYTGNMDLDIQGGSFEQGVYGQALSLDGSGAQAISEKGGDFINGLDAITIAMWVKSNETGTDKGFFAGREPDGSDKYLCIRYDVAGANGGGTNVIKAGVITDQGKTTVESANNVQTTEWQHVAMVWRSTESIQLYIDGIPDEPTANEGPLGGVLSELTAIIIGRSAKDQSGGWNGLVDDVYVYGEALSADDIKKIMDGGALSVDVAEKLPTIWGRIKISHRIE